MQQHRNCFCEEKAETIEHNQRSSSDEAALCCSTSRWVHVAMMQSIFKFEAQFKKKQADVGNNAGY